MKQLFEALTALLKVKTIVTLVIIVVLAVLSLNGSVEPDKFLTIATMVVACLLYTSPSPRDLSTSRMPSSA